MSVLAVPFGGFVNQIPMPVFLGIHIALFLVAVYLAQSAVRVGGSGLAWGFGLFALSELSYMTYHLDWTVFLFAHTVSEVLVALAFIVIFVSATRKALVRPSAAGLEGEKVASR